MSGPSPKTNRSMAEISRMTGVSVLFGLAIAAAVETVGANLFFWQADGFADSAERIEFQGVHSRLFPYQFHHVGIFFSGLVSVGLDVADGASLELLNAAARDEFEVVFRGREVEERASVYEWRTTDPDMHFFASAVVEHLHVVAQLRTPDDGVVAKDHFFPLQHFAAGNEFHTGDEAPLLLVDGHKTT